MVACGTNSRPEYGDALGGIASSRQDTSRRVMRRSDFSGERKLSKGFEVDANQEAIRSGGCTRLGRSFGPMRPTSRWGNFDQRWA
ncbi:MAG: hypothetical protein ACP5O0_00020 [Acidimicrobiales bacterium]